MTERMADAGLQVRRDAANNLIGSLAGTRGSGPALATGSHTDTVEGGGRFDGIIGVLAALVAVRTLREQGIRLRHDLRVVDFLNEEPNQFGLSCVGGRAIAGSLLPAHLELDDGAGDTLAAGLTRVGGDPGRVADAAWDAAEVAAFLELNIEQGPVLEREELPIAVVSAIAGIDRYQKLSVQPLTLFIMGGATFLVGVLPTFAAIGVAAPILLVVLRFVQGIAVGGEWGGAVLMAVEHSPPGRRGFNGSWPQVGVPAGLLLSTGAFGLLAALPDEAFEAWGWRVPFLASLVLVVVGLAIRLKVVESPEFVRMQQDKAPAKLPLVELLRNNPSGVLVCIGIRIGTDVSFYVHSVYALSYLTTNLGLPRSIGLTATLIAAGIEIVTIPIAGLLSDRYGRRRVMMAGAAMLALWAWPFFWLLDSRTSVGITMAIVVGIAVAQATVYSPMAAFFSELFAPRVRYSGISVGYQVAGVFGGGLAPIIATALFAISGGYGWIAVYVAATAALTLLCVALGTRRRTRPAAEVALQQPAQ
ncbi:MFS transporter [Saccharopolyspora hattusasensis]|uniref:MFS transporter n=1 Tax=Saccharopolyspora hattusasensis TaxID=1128679 RepID=UPI003D965BF4